MGWLRTWGFIGLFAFALAVGCGGGDAGSSDEGGGATAGGTSSGSEDPTDSGRRRAVTGDVCDYGGNAEHTCQRGLYCCYGPPDDPGEHGRCMDECPEY